MNRQFQIQFGRAGVGYDSVTATGVADALDRLAQKRGYTNWLQYLREIPTKVHHNGSRIVLT